LINCCQKHTFSLPPIGDSLNGLFYKCELARQEIKAYREEIGLLKILQWNIKKFQERKNDVNFSNYCKNENLSPEMMIAYWTILRTSKSDINETRIREILKDLGLPQDYTITIRSYEYGRCVTKYELEPDPEKRKELIKKAEEEAAKSVYLKPLNKTVKLFDKNYRISIRFKNGKPKELHIIYSQYSDQMGEEAKKHILANLSAKRFNIKEKRHWIFADKSIKLSGDESIQKLKRLVKEALT
jgi:hypothetical protein